ncbi:MAG: GNAT family N-acetyltransferase [Candidatus Obscuribacterales bacterium]
MIRPEQEKDFEAVRKVIELAFGSGPDGNCGEAELVEMLRESDSYIPELSLVAENDSIQGHIMVSRVSLEPGPGQAKDSPVAALALAPLAVSPGHQGRGIGSSLVRESVKIADALGHGLIIVLGDHRYYRRFGFETASAFGIRCPFEVPEEHYMVLPLSGYKEEMKGLVVYPEPFKSV